VCPDPSLLLAPPLPSLPSTCTHVHTYKYLVHEHYTSSITYLSLCLCIYVSIYLCIRACISSIGKSPRAHPATHKRHYPLLTTHPPHPLVCLCRLLASKSRC
jgi:hypothetical protein